MQTERVTFLTTPDHKAALDAFARNSGMSVGHVVREASAIYIAQAAADEDEQQLAALVREVNEAVPRMRADIRDAIATIDRANAVVDAVLSGEGSRQ
jgi:KaiC/GvpD/RAD55 family RecA-like ATPase